MKTSESIGNIGLALAEAQAELRNPSKDKTASIEGPKARFKYSYADFATALEGIRPILAKHKIAFVQATRFENPLVMLETRLIHESGEWLANDYPVGNVGDHRTMGSALSYARRYALFPLIGVQGEDDDDGEADQQRSRQNHNQEAPEMPSVNGRPDASKGASRNDYEACIKEIRNMASASALLNWYKANAGRMDQLPADWIDELRIEYTDKLRELKAALAA